MNQYPASNFHDLNLDWLLEQMKNCLAEWNETKTDWENLEADNTEFKAYVTNYFDNLDVSDEISAKIDELVEDGTLLEIITDDPTGEGSALSDAVGGWISAHLHPEPTDVMIDDSLTVSGAAADAKTVGDIVFDLQDKVNIAFKTGKQFLKNPDPGFYLNNSGTITRYHDESNVDWRTFDSFSVKAGVYFTNETPNNFSYAKYSNDTVVAFPTIANRITNNLYEINLQYDAIIYYTNDNRVVLTSAVMFCSLELPAQYADDIFKVAYQFENAFIDSQRVFVVGKTQKYRTIQAACNAASAGDTILVLPGDYFEQVSIWGKKLHIIGTNKQLCKLIDTSGNYDTPPLEMNVGTLANITIMETGTTADPSLPDGKYKTSYCLHIESGENANGEEFLIENCNFINNVHACIGCGLYENLTVHFRNCSFHSTDEGSRGDDWERATFYYHSNTGENVNGQRMIVENCLIHAAKQYCVWAGKVGGSSGSTISTFVGNTLYSDTHYNTDSVINSNFDSEFVLSEASSGNNVNKLNNGIQTKNMLEYKRFLGTSDNVLTLPYIIFTHS